MANNKEVLVQFVYDSIVGYEADVTTLSILRRKQIDKIRELCDKMQTDAMLIFSLTTLIDQINEATFAGVRWFYAKPSRLARCLQAGISHYKQALSDYRKHTLNKDSHSVYVNYQTFYQQQPPSIPNIEVLQTEAKALMLTCD